jgi:hypothetical protein
MCEFFADALRRKHSRANLLAIYVCACVVFVEQESGFGNSISAAV